jgi:alpha-glucosidase (family GH31 glycosyl hydrolase)
MPFPPYVSAAYAAIFKSFYDARIELGPALYAAYSLAADTGLPAVRHPVVDFPGDSRALGGVLDEYILGTLLVAPAPIGGSSRNVYFPAGTRC